MLRIPSSPPIILPVPPGLKRPLWSVMIPVYNCLEYLEETLKSVLMQNISEEEMQIEVIDDASTDGDVEAFVNRIGAGKIKYFKQQNNVGSLRNFETCINRSRGIFIHILHGDDRIRDGYYKTIGNLLNKYPDCGAAFCRFSYIDEKGHFLYNQPSEVTYEGVLQNWLLTIAERQRIQYVAITVRREAYEKLGGFYGLTYAEDWEMWVRIARHFATAYTPQILANYRKHTQSISAKKFLNAEYLHDLNDVMELIQPYLPAEHSKTILKKSKKFYAHYAIKMANQLWHLLHNRKVVELNIKEGLKMHKDLLMYYRIVKIYLKILLGWK